MGTSPSTERGFKFTHSVGKILRVDLSEKKWILNEIDPEIIKTFLGGIGLSAKILFEETGPQTDPLGPENIVIISAGLLTGIDAPTAYRVEVTTKSPLTGIVGTGNAGGLFATNLRKAGYEAVVLNGKSEVPVYLVIDDEKIQLKNAEHLWGKDTFTTTAAIKNEMGEDFSVMAIGQAGENLVKFACPVFDCYHSPGRSHTGCVMGSKNIKAVAVRGSRNIPIACLEKFRKTSEEINYRIKDYPEKGLRQHVGSISKVVNTARRGHLQAKNYQTGVLPISNDLWEPEKFKKYVNPGPPFCGECLLSPVYGCNATAHIKEGKYKDLYMRGIGFSVTLWNWASKCAIGNLPAVIKCKELCNRYGMDQEGSIPFALELFQRGVLTQDDFGGQEMNWGDEDAICNLITKIAYRQWIGDILAEGSARAAKLIGKGAEKYSVTIKGMEALVEPDPRAGGRDVKNLGCLINIRGGDDLKTTHTIFENIPDWVNKQEMKKEDYKEWFLKRLDMPDDIKEKIYGAPPDLDSSNYTSEQIVSMVKWYEDLSFVRDSLGICLFAVQTTSAIGSRYSAELLSSYLDWNVSTGELIKIGERILNLLKAYNLREGLTKSDDDFPERFFLEPLKDGSRKEKVLSRDYISQLLNIYYETRGWDEITGRPRKEKLEELGLGFVAHELQERKLL